jgi:8-oxo-dGTP pyrophosphatase MutT (NUDIX family)
MVTRIRAVGIVEHEECLLLIQRKKNGPTYWVFPGGGVEQGEAREDAVVREVHEETSIEVTSPTLWATLPGDTDYAESHFYHCLYVRGVPALSSKSPEYKRMMTEEGNEYYPQWVPLSRLSSLQVFPQTIAEQLIHEHEMKKVAQK